MVMVICPISVARYRSAETSLQIVEASIYLRLTLRVVAKTKVASAPVILQIKFPLSFPQSRRIKTLQIKK